VKSHRILSQAQREFVGSCVHSLDLDCIFGFRETTDRALELFVVVKESHLDCLNLACLYVFEFSNEGRREGERDEGFLLETLCEGDHSLFIFHVLALM